MQFDIKWHDAKLEMPGYLYDYDNHWYGKFLIRYSWEDDFSVCFYTTANLVSGQFNLDLDHEYYEYENKEQLHKEAKITHWAMVDHPSDYD
jgi:hypothetical protein